MAFAKTWHWISGVLGTKPLTVVTLLALVIATYHEWYWPWGLLFLYWVVAGLSQREAFLVERISKERNPILYWSITGMWAGFGLWTLYADLVWRLA